MSEGEKGKSGVGPQMSLRDFFKALSGGATSIALGGSKVLTGVELKKAREIGGKYCARFVAVCGDAYAQGANFIEALDHVRDGNTFDERTVRNWPSLIDIYEKNIKEAFRLAQEHKSSGNIEVVAYIEMHEERGFPKTEGELEETIKRERKTLQEQMNEALEIQKINKNGETKLLALYGNHAPAGGGYGENRYDPNRDPEGPSPDNDRSR